jgi:hypothetical protein
MPTVEEDFVVAESQLVDFYLQTSYKFLGSCPSIPHIPV